MDNLLLFYGEEKFLVDEEIEKLKSKIIPKGLEAVNFTVLDGRTVQLEEIINLSRTVPMMSDKRLVVISGARFFDSKERSIEETESKNTKKDDLLAFLQVLPSYTYILFVCEKVDKRKKLFNFIQKNGIVREYAPLSIKEKVHWVQKRFSLYGKKVSVSVATFIAQYTDSLYQTDSEIKKIVAFMGERTNAEQKDLEAVFSKALENSIFDLTDYIGMKKPAQAVFVLNELLSQGEKAITILFMISKHIMNMISIKLMEKADFDDIKQALGLHPFVIKKTMEQSRNFSLSELKKALKLCQEADLNIKQGKLDEKTAVELLLLNISGR